MNAQGTSSDPSLTVVLVVGGALLVALAFQTNRQVGGLLVVAIVIGMLLSAQKRGYIGGT